MFKVLLANSRLAGLAAVTTVFTGFLTYGLNTAADRKLPAYAYKVWRLDN
eukprot:gene8145-8987_t